MTNQQIINVGDKITDADLFNLLPVGAVLTDKDGWVHTKVRDWVQFDGKHCTTYVDDKGGTGTFGQPWLYAAVLTSVPEPDAAVLARETQRADQNFNDLLEVRAEVAALRTENEALREQVARLSALHTYVREELLTDDQIAACAGFTHGYMAGALA